MSDPALLDLLEERGVLALVMTAVRNRLQLSVPFRGCSCADKEVAQFGGFPHGRRCSAWLAVSALGLLEELVVLDHQRALTMSNAADDEIQHLIRGRRVSRDRVVAELKRDGWETGAFFHREVDRVMAAQQQLIDRDTARESESEMLAGLKRHALINDPNVREFIRQRNETPPVEKTPNPPLDGENHGAT